MSVNFHPPLTAFPPALLCTVVVFELLGAFQKSDKLTGVSRYLVRFLAIITPLTYLSGYYGNVDLAGLDADAAQLVSRHQTYAKVLLVSLFATVILSELRFDARRLRRTFTLSYLLSLLLTVALIFVVAGLGGELVFEHGVGVSTGVSN